MRVLKYNLDLENGGLAGEFDIPSMAFRPLSVQKQGDRWTLWGIVDDNQKVPGRQAKLRVFAIGTNQQFAQDIDYIDTVQTVNARSAEKRMVWHLFYDLKVENVQADISGFTGVGVHGNADQLRAVRDTINQLLGDS